jgi:hypothetical protein
MPVFQLGSDLEGIRSTFTQNQLNKFTALSKRITVINGAAYLPINELHGVLLTNSKKNALKIINNHDDVIKNYLVRDKLKFPGCLFSTAIKPIGVCLLLDELASSNPRKADEYRESSFILSYIIACNPELKIQSQELANKLDSDLKALVYRLKRAAKVCQISKREFRSGEEKHVHHIESKACFPQLMGAGSNLLIISKETHDGYHAWLFKNGGDIDRISLTKYAEENGYSLPSIA